MVAGSNPVLFFFFLVKHCSHSNNHDALPTLPTPIRSGIIHEYTLLLSPLLTHKCIIIYIIIIIIVVFSSCRGHFNHFIDFLAKLKQGTVAGVTVRLDRLQALISTSTTEHLEFGGMDDNSDRALLHRLA